MNRKISIMIILFAATLIPFTPVSAEKQEQGLEEIEQLVEITQVDSREGMSLEEISDAISETAMSEYADSASGFRMQYPSVFRFDDETEGNQAVTEDGKATLEIINHEGVLAEETLVESIQLLIPDAKPVKHEQNGCLQVDTTEDDGRICRTELYFLTKKSFHHVIIRFPAEEKDIYSPYIEYMINTMETNDTDLG